MYRIMAMEVSKNISRGLHKNGRSIREMLLKSSSLNATFNNLREQYPMSPLDEVGVFKK